MLRREHVKALWKLTGGFEIVDIGHGFFMVQFDIEADKEKVLEGGTYFQAGTNNNTAQKIWTRNIQGVILTVQIISHK